MRISKPKLEELITEEVHQYFNSVAEAERRTPHPDLRGIDLGPAPAKRAPQRRGQEEYPAAEMAAITATIFKLADKAGVNPGPDAREKIVDELQVLLRQEGYELHEQNLILGDELPITIDNSSPELWALIKNIEAQIPGAATEISKTFKRGGITASIALPAAVAARSKSAASEAPPSADDEDQTATIKTAPTDAPDDPPRAPHVVPHSTTPTSVGPVPKRAKASRPSGEPAGTFEPLFGADEEDDEEDQEEKDYSDQVNPEDMEGLSDEECAELFDIDDPDIKKVLDQAQADSTIRGKVASIGRDLSLTMDAVTIASLGVAATGVGAAPGIAVAGATATASVVGSAIAVAMDLLNGQFKQAAIDAIGLIPFGSGAGKAGREVGEVAAKEAAQQAAKEAAEQAGKRALAKSGEKAAAKASASAAKSAQAGIQSLVKGAAKAPAAMEARLVTMMVDKGVDETIAKVLAPMMMKKAQGKLQEKLAANMKDFPSRDAYESDEEYTAATKSYYASRREQSAAIMSRCMKSQDSEAAKAVKWFLDEIHDWVDDIPGWLSTAVKWGMNMFGDDEDQTATVKTQPVAPVAEILSLKEHKEFNRMKVLAGIK